MPTTQPFQWVPYSTAYYLNVGGIAMGGRQLFSASLGNFLLDRAGGL